MVDIAVSIGVSLVTRPKPDSELRGLVYSLTPKEDRTETAAAGDHGWYRKPVLLAGIALAMTIGLNIWGGLGMLIFAAPLRRLGPPPPDRRTA